ncbi:hypothetical protein BN12_4190002 [Nostocoides japonicum T1-X7]|uniref:Uncharacterized protein n=1 Tax=Nostocoides japonicum T1-X7 TaxID=1194083 RepID=A0A077M2R5_9MICO|nr:hypothetical protein BN12_300027 [Tetrasphaera japonica T1-X7]CCH79362.1 hypothetical protein BN12_4190002 [Tetrasphaera japonica T1-X7]
MALWVGYDAVVEVTAPTLSTNARGRESVAVRADPFVNLCPESSGLPPCWRLERIGWGRCARAAALGRAHRRLRSDRRRPTAGRC